MEKHEIPTHLEVEDKILFNLTIRQFLLFLSGAGAGYYVWLALPMLTNIAGLVVRLVLALLPFLLAGVVALVQPAGRPLEEWIFVTLRYAIVPKLYLYRPLEEEFLDKDVPQQQPEHATHIDELDEDED